MPQRTLIAIVAAGLAAVFVPSMAVADECSNADASVPECGPSAGQGPLGGGGELLPSWDQIGSVAPGAEGAGFAPFACLANSCGNIAGGDCAWYQSFEIDAEISSGQGSATVAVRCGDDEVACTVSTDAEPVCHAEFAHGPGGFFCGVIEKEGVKVSGSCKDPANPAAVYRFAMGSTGHAALRPGA